MASRSAYGQLLAACGHVFAGVILAAEPESPQTDGPTYDYKMVRVTVTTAHHLIWPTT
jgi:hypothetical protein